MYINVVVVVIYVVNKVSHGSKKVVNKVFYESKKYRVCLNWYFARKQMGKDYCLSIKHKTKRENK